MTDIAAILHLDVEAGRLTQFLHAGRHQGEDLGIRKLHELHESALGDGLCGVLLALALVPVFQPGKGKARILARAGEAEAGDDEREVHIVLLVFEIEFRHFLGHGHGAFLHRAGGQGDQGDDKALVFVRQKPGGQAHKQERH